jgi:hypothetical protein
MHPQTPLRYWHLLSLDAPTVAIVWTGFVAQCAHLELPQVLLPSMFAAVWILYAGDRLLDSHPRVNNHARDRLQERHHFHARHRLFFLAMLVLVTIGLTRLLIHIPLTFLVLYLVLCGVLGVYFVLIHMPPIALPKLPKELIVGVFFAAAVFAPLTHSPLFFALPAAIFAGVCTLNCLFINFWEGENKVSKRRIYLLSAALLMFCVVGLCSEEPWALFAACLFSVALLLALHVLRNRLAPLTLRACADLVLLTPVLFMRIL